MDVTLPNGRVMYGLPDGMTKKDVAGAAIGQGYATLQDFSELFPDGKLPEVDDDPTFLENVGGVLADLGIGAQRATKSLVDLVAVPMPESLEKYTTDPLSEFFERGIEATEWIKPEAYKEAQQRSAIKRDTEGNFESFQAPSWQSVAGITAGSLPQIPSFLVGGGALGTVMKASKWLKAHPKFAEAIGYGIVNASLVAPSQWRDTYNEAIDSGMSEEDAKDAADTASLLTALVSGTTGALGGAVGIKMGMDSKNIGTAMAKGLVAEAPFEGIEEAGQSVSADIGMGRPISGINALESGTMGFIGGGLPGAGVAGVTHINEKLDPRNAAPDTAIRMEQQLRQNRLQERIKNRIILTEAYDEGRGIDNVYEDRDPDEIAREWSAEELFAHGIDFDEYMDVATAADQGDVEAQDKLQSWINEGNITRRKLRNINDVLTGKKPPPTPTVETVTRSALGKVNRSIMDVIGVRGLDEGDHIKISKALQLSTDKKTEENKDARLKARQYLDQVVAGDPAVKAKLDDAHKLLKAAKTQAVPSVTPTPIDMNRYGKYLENLEQRMKKLGLKEFRLSLMDTLRNAAETYNGQLVYGVREARGIRDNDRISYDKYGAFVYDEGDATAYGYFNPNIGRIFMSIDNAFKLPNGKPASEQEAMDRFIKTLNHETVHALKSIDLFTKNEWDVLLKAAKNRKSRHLDGEGNPMTYSQWAEKNYSDLPVFKIEEEAIAELISGENNLTNMTGLPRTLINRLKAFITQMRSALSGTGYDTFESILHNFETGKIGKRERGKVRTLQEITAKGWQDKAVVDTDIKLLGEYEEINSLLAENGLSGFDSEDYADTGGNRYLNMKGVLASLDDQGLDTQTTNNIRGKATQWLKQYEKTAKTIGVDYEARLDQTAWHGSGAIFDQFSTNHIGEGEGNQVRGWGLYFGEQEETGQHYYKMLGGKRKIPAKILFDGEVVDVSSVGAIAKFAEKHRLDTLRTMGLQKIAKYGGIDEALAADSINSNQSVNNWIRKHKDKIYYQPAREENQGALYKVDISDETVAQMLDLDKPISEQTVRVQEVAERLGFQRDENGEELVKYIEDYFRNEDYDMDYALMDHADDFSADHMSSYFDRPSEPRLTPEERTSRFLYENGIPGNKFDDGWSRTNTKNNVLVDGVDVASNQFDLPSNMVRKDAITADMLIGSLEDGLLTLDQVLEKVGNNKKLHNYFKNVQVNPPKRTQNYVVFNDNDITILTRNGEPISQKTEQDTQDYLNARSDQRGTKDYESEFVAGQQDQKNLDEKENKRKSEKDARIIPSEQWWVNAPKKKTLNLEEPSIKAILKKHRVWDLFNPPETSGWRVRSRAYAYHMAHTNLITKEEFLEAAISSVPDARDQYSSGKITFEEFKNKDLASKLQDIINSKLPNGDYFNLVESITETLPTEDEYARNDPEFMASVGYKDGIYQPPSSRQVANSRWKSKKTAEEVFNEAEEIVYGNMADPDSPSIPENINVAGAIAYEIGKLSQKYGVDISKRMVNEYLSNSQLVNYLNKSNVDHLNTPSYSDQRGTKVTDLNKARSNKLKEEYLKVLRIAKSRMTEEEWFNLQNDINQYDPAVIKSIGERIPPALKEDFNEYMADYGEDAWAWENLSEHQNNFLEEWASLEPKDNNDLRNVLLAKRALGMDLPQRIDHLNTPSYRRRGVNNPATPQSFTAPGEYSRGKNAIWRLQDKLVGLKDIENAINQARLANGQDKLTALESAYIGEELSHGRIGERAREFTDQETKPLINAISEAGLELADVDEFLVLRHAIERNERIRKVNPNKQDAGAGVMGGNALTDAFVLNEMLNRFGMEWDANLGLWRDVQGVAPEVRDRRDKMNAIAERIDAIVKGTLTEAHTSGLIDDGDYTTLNTFYRYYAPLRGFGKDMLQEMDEDTNKGTAGTGGSINIVGKHTQKAKGRSSEAYSPTATIIAERERTIARGVKNKDINNRMFNLIQENPNPEVWEIIGPGHPRYDQQWDSKYTYVGNHPSIPYGTKKSKIANQPDQDNWIKRLVTAKVEKPLNPKGDELIGVKVDGEQYFMDIKDDRLRKSLLNLDRQEQNKIVNALGNVNRFLSFMNTTLNPEFVIGNFSRDIQTAIASILNEKHMTGGMLSEVRTKEITRKVIKGLFESGKTFYKKARQQEGHLTTLSTQQDNEIMEFLNAGAKADWFHSRPVEQQRANLQLMLDMANGTFKGTTIARMKSVKDFVEDGNAAVENAVRFSTFKVAKQEFMDAGLSREEAVERAASMAKNMTINFNRKGESGNLLNSIYLFFNAQVQGTAVIFRGIKSPTKQKILGGITAMGMFMAMLHEFAEDEDDPESKGLEEVEDFVRERNMIIPIPGSDKSVKIPLPYGYNFFYQLGSNAYLMGRGKMSVGKATAELAHTFLGSFNPVGAPAGSDPAASTMRLLAPTALTPIVEIATNENYFGRPIYKEQFDFGTPIPDSHRTFKNTDPILKWIAQSLNKVGGGNAHESGVIDVSPDTMSYLIGYGLGGAGAFTERALVKPAGKMMEGKAPFEEFNDMPFVRRFMHEYNNKPSFEDYYDHRDMIEQKWNHIETLKGAELKSYRDENLKYLRFKEVYDQSEKQLKVLRAQQKQIDQVIALKPERAEQLSENQERIQDNIDKIIRKVNAFYKEKVGK